MSMNKAGLIVIAGVIALSGCAATSTPETDRRHGQTMNLIRAQQTLNPDASRNTNPVAGFDGKAAKGALDNYRDSFRKPPSETANFLSIGGASGGTR